ncbi:hypothetical protein C6P42_000332 [Pichia californica]|nr:hypothetical protein C6P42_000332 [[Candida] californica]
MPTRSFSTVLRLANKASKVETDSLHGSFKTFAEYRESIIKKDPESLQTRFKIMLTSGKPASVPETQAEQHAFSDIVKKVAYNA